MALFRRFFYRKPPDRLLEISERVYVFDCCFSTDVLEEDEYRVYMGGIVAQLQDHFPDASFMVFNFREGERRSQISDILSQYDMTVMDYPQHYEGCPLLPLEMIHHFLRSSESWLSLEGQQNVLLMHCERGGWPVLAFMLAGLLLYRKQYSGEQKTLDMVYKQAPNELLHLLSPLNPQPSQLRYLQYISRRNIGSDWPPSDTPLLLDCLILRVLPLFDGGKGCRPVIRVYGQDPSTPANRSSKLLFSTSKTKKNVRHYLQQGECMLVKIDIHCRVQGDIVLECIHLDEDLVHEEMIFIVMFHTAFVRSNILMLNRNEIDVPWDAKDQFPKDFSAEVLFSDADAVVPALTTVVASEGNEAEIASPEEFFEVEEIFSNVVDGQEGKGDLDPYAFQDCASDDGTHKRDGKLVSSIDAVKDIGVDDVKYKMDEKVGSDHLVKDIGVDDGDIKLDFILAAADMQPSLETKEVVEDLCGKLDEMGDKGDGGNSFTQKTLDSRVPQKKLTADVPRQKSEKVLPNVPKKQPTISTKPAADSVVAKQKTKQQESHAKLAKPNAVSRWIPPNKGSYTNSMHVSYPPSRYNSAPAALGVNVPSKDSNAVPKLKASSDTPTTVVSTDVTNGLKSCKVDPVKPSGSTQEAVASCPPSLVPSIKDSYSSPQTQAQHINLQQVVPPPPPPPPPPQHYNTPSFSTFPSMYPSSPSQPLQVGVTPPPPPPPPPLPLKRQNSATMFLSPTPPPPPPPFLSTFTAPNLGVGVCTPPPPPPPPPPRLAVLMSPISLLSVLTEDLLVRVYTGLGSDSDRKTWRIVCKDFLRVDLVTRRSLRILRFEFLQRLLFKYTNLDSLDLSVCPRIEDGAISLLLSRPEWLNWTRCLTRLTLSRATGLRHSGLELLLRACPRLEAVDVSYCWGYGDMEASAISCAKGLRELRMDKCLGVTDVGLAKIAVGCGKLERLSLKWCMEISDLGVELLCKKCLDLKSLDVSYLKLTSESLRSIASMPKLEVLAMSGCPFVDDVGLQFLENRCPLLQVIDISRCEFLTSSSLQSVARGHNGLLQLNAGYCLSRLPATVLHCLKDMKNLNTIRIDGARVSDSSLEIISSNCKSLVEIGLSKCVGVTDMGIMQLVSGCVDLKIVNLTCCRSITDVAISALAKSCWKLVCLKLESCDKVTEKSLNQLGSCCLGLEEIDLTDCSGVDDKGLKYLSGCSELLCLKLGLCTNISDKGLAYIACNCTRISELDLYRCTGIGDEGLAALTNGCKKLMKLNLSYCNGVTDRGMHYIGHLKELSDLEMRGLINITSVGLTAVAAGCKRLAELDLKHCEKIDDSGFWALAYYSRNMRQINMSYCAVSDVGLCMVMGNLTRLQDAKLVHLTKVTVKGFELALRACSVRIRKLKLNSRLRLVLSSETLETLHARGCMFRWD